MVAVLRRCRCARGCSGCCLVRLWGRAAWCARGRRPAREIATREPAARSDRSRSPARPRRRPRAPPPGPPVPSGALHTSGALLADGARCVVSKAGLASPPPTGTAVRPCRPGGRLSETGVAFAHMWLCGVETGIAFACEKWVFLVRFLGAVVMPVSAVRCWGCAVVLLVSMSPWCRVWCARKFARRRCVIAKVRKSSPSALKLAQIQRFCACWASFFAGMSLEGLCWVSFFAPIGPASVLDAMRCTSGWLRLGGLRHAKPSGGVSPACRRLGWRHSPVWRRGRAVGCEPTNFARNSSVTISGFELVSLELQRFGLLLKFHAIE